MLKIDILGPAVNRKQLYSIAVNLLTLKIFEETSKNYTESYMLLHTNEMKKTQLVITLLDETRLDETGVDKMSIRRNRIRRTGPNSIWWELTSGEVISWEVDLVGVDLGR